MNKTEIIQKIKQLEGLSNDERAYLVELVNTKKKYGLVWEDKPEDVEEQLRTHLPSIERSNRKSNSPQTSPQPEKKPVTKQPPSSTTTLKTMKQSGSSSSPSGRPGGAPNHILIEGDNLHALTALTFTHEGQIDVMYFDPPYNTGNKDFKYNDSFVDREDSYRHSKWLSFMDKRLRIAKRLLSEKGVIFISISMIMNSNLKLAL
jgi:adenine-specific DNA-methyltransferase